MSFTPDRHLTVPRGAVVRTAYVDVFSIRPACRDRMAVGDVDIAYRKLLQLGDAQSFPCPYGHWHLDTFVLVDGRHEWLASVMLGKTHVLVAWLEPGFDTLSGGHAITHNHATYESAERIDP